MADKCPAFNVTIKGDPAEVFEKTKKAKLDGGLKLEITGDATKGSLEIKGPTGTLVYGDYTVKDKKITFNMVDDTILADCKKIEAKIAGAFKGL